MLGQLARQDQPYSSLDLSGGDCWLFVVSSQRSSLNSNLLKDVSNKGVQDRHGLRRDSSIGVDLFQDLPGEQAAVR